MKKESIFVVIDGYQHWYDYDHLQGQTVEVVPYYNQKGRLSRYDLVVGPHNDTLFTFKHHSKLPFNKGKSDCGDFNYEGCWISPGYCEERPKNNRDATHLLSEN